MRLNMKSYNDSSLRVLEKLRRELGESVVKALHNPNVFEIMLNPDGQIWIEDNIQGMSLIGSMRASAAESVMCTIADYIGSTVDKENPIIECELPLDGSRFEGLFPPIVSAPAFSIRKKISTAPSLGQYVLNGIMSDHIREEIISSIDLCKNILVVGGTGSGKTTLLNAFLNSLTERWPQHRLLILEDTRELQSSSLNTVCLRTSDNITMNQLLKATMRLRPDRIIIGEVRGGEALSLLKAWNTGHPGGFASIHANDAKTGLLRMEQLIAEVTETPMQKIIGECIHIVVVIKKTPLGRKITEVVKVNGYENQNYVLDPIFTLNTKEKEEFLDEKQRV